MKYKNANNELFVDPIVENHDGLILLTELEFEEELAILNAPAPLTPLEIRNTALGSITYTRPSDGVEIQVRHPDYASDYLMMKEAHDNMGSGDVEGWIDINNNPITMTKQDFADAMSHNRSEIKVIFATYIATL
jgi:hypothetical protein